MADDEMAWTDLKRALRPPPGRSPACAGKRLGDLVRAEAMRRGGAFARRANEYARQAEQAYGTRPVSGDDLRIVFGQVFGTELNAGSTRR
ncbi:hypothetical protein [Burkholderia pyrrocinia]|uniref:hypothetical protein n=1 Tax=Burkholderia pyrrocinia TaxID=60550 RepID=UPI001BCC2415|nr:hypothetical protein [Burkholderia pyrrocinia]QVN18948.1 hypothetical protein JYG32_04205 [Burkholderia pyrrocinia]